MPSLNLLIFQAGIILVLLYFAEQFPKFDSNLQTLQSAITQKAVKFSLTNKAKSSYPSEEPSKPSEEPSEPPAQPSSLSEEPKQDSNTPHSSLPSGQNIKYPHSSSPGGSIYGDNIEDFSLNVYPSIDSSKPGTISKRKNQRRANLCKITGEGCVRYTPTEELQYFWIVCALYTPNQPGTEQLYELHANFINYVKLYGINTQVIEVIFAEQDYKVTRPNNEPYELQYKAEWIFNMRENLVNVGSKKLPNDWEYIAWVDAHIVFDENKYWFEDLIVELHKNNIVHMFGSNDFYNEKNVSVFHEEGFAKLWQKLHSPVLPPIRQCGMAWATRRDIFERTNGLLDVCIGTKCDLYQNYAYLGMVFTEECLNPEYANAVKRWQENAIPVYDSKIGYVKGNVVHFQHCGKGCKTSNYDGMTKALMRNNYNPNSDLKRDEEGRLQFVSNWQLARDLWVFYGGKYRY